MGLVVSPMFSRYVTYLDPWCRRVSLLIWEIYASYVLRICVVELRVVELQALVKQSSPNLPLLVPRLRTRLSHLTGGLSQCI